jgi:hypothetical protein
MIEASSAWRTREPATYTMFGSGRYTILSPRKYWLVCTASRTLPAITITMKLPRVSLLSGDRLAADMPSLATGEGGSRSKHESHKMCHLGRRRYGASHKHRELMQANAKAYTSLCCMLLLIEGECGHRTPTSATSDLVVCLLSLLQSAPLQRSP